VTTFGVIVHAGRVIGPARRADDRAERRIGLLRTASLDGVLHLPGVTAVHTMGMAYAIDVAYLRDGHVLAIRTMAPTRLGRRRRRADGVIEALAGSFAAWGVAVGDEVELRYPPEPA
jgi:uncharacterized membrane protein (UPF0127 family)